MNDAMCRSRAIWHIATIAATVLATVTVSLLWLGRLAKPERWLLDGPWDDGRTFFEIATTGYSLARPESFRELVLYPLVLRVFAPLFGVWALFVVSVAASIATSVLMYLIARRWYVSGTAAFVFALVFSIARLPTFFVPAFTVHFPSMTLMTSIQGSEPLFLSLVLGSFLAFKGQRWALAFVLIGLATVTRVTGLLVAGAYCIWLLSRRRPFPALWGAVPVAFLALHFAYFAALTGDFLAFFRGHGAFYKEGTLTIPFMDLLRAFTTGYRRVWETRAGWIANYAYCIVALVFLARRDRLLFWMTAPSFLLFVSLNGWALHARYYVTLWAIPFAYLLWWAGPRQDS